MANIIAAVGIEQALQRAIVPVDLAFDPLEALALWPESEPLTCLISARAGSAEAARWSRWSVLAAPTGVLRCWANEAGGACRSEWVALEPGAHCPVALGDDPIEMIGAAARATADGVHDPDHGGLPFAGGWLASVSYDAGRLIEPRALAQARDGPGARRDRDWPLVELWRCPGALVHDGLKGKWWAVGERAAIPGLEQHAARAGRSRIGTMKSLTGRRGYEESVERALELIRAGDIFQANIAHRISARFHGSARGLARRLLAHSGAWYGAYLESPGANGLERAVCSASPELFLKVDGATRRIVTRPIKGTIAAEEGSTALLASEKNRAELTMITDLMRNDVGRICEYGSVRVDEARAAERHGARAGAQRGAGVYHTVATVSGMLRRDVTVGTMLRATFPPGSVTGAPKIRAMQVIDALEPVQRGMYCGSIGFISDAGDSCWNVAIRTASLSLEPGSTAAGARGVLDYSVGAGIVADSRPDEEWRETLHKAGVLRAAVARPRRAGARR